MAQAREEAKAGVYLRAFLEWASWWNGKRGAACTDETARFQPTLLVGEGEVEVEGGFLVVEKAGGEEPGQLLVMGEVVEEAPKKARLTLIRGGK